MEVNEGHWRRPVGCIGSMKVRCKSAWLLHFAAAPQIRLLSPVLSDVMLDDLDRELWGRGHRFVRYADDLRVFVRSERAAQRVFGSVCGVLERRLRLRVNREKSSIRHAAQATLLGFGFLLTGPQVRIRVARRRSNASRTSYGF